MLSAGEEGPAVFGLRAGTRRLNGNRVVVAVTVNGAKQSWTYHESGSDVWARQ